MVLKFPPHSQVTWESLPADVVLPDDPVENILRNLVWRAFGRSSHWL